MHSQVLQEQFVTHRRGGAGLSLCPCQGGSSLLPREGPRRLRARPDGALSDGQGQGFGSGTAAGHGSHLS